MTDTPVQTLSLAEVRQELDRLDDQMHRLLIERAEVVRGVAAAKRAQNGDGKVGFAVRPGREAQMMRAFYERHQGDLPFTVVARLWREIINAMTRLQNALAVAIVDEDDALGAGSHDDFVRRYDVVRSHWGTVTPILRHKTIEGVLASLNGDDGVMGVIDVAGRGDDWWLPLARYNRQNPEGRRYIVAPLPFFHEQGNDRIDGFAISPMPPEESGEDVTLLAVEQGTVPGVDVLASCGFEPATDCPATPGLVALDGFFDENNETLIGLAGMIDGQVHYLGAYARPLTIT